MEYHSWLKDAAVFLVAAGLAAPVFRAFKQSAVLAFLVVGLVVGPFGLGRLVETLPWLRYFTIENPHAAEPFAEAGVLFLLFLLGLELSFKRLWSWRKNVFGFGSFQVGLSTVAITAVGWALGLDPAIALVIGLALSLSSTAIVMQMLIEERQVATSTGRTTFSVLLFQDLAVAPILILVGFLTLNGDGGILPALGQALIGGVIAIAIIALAGRYFLRRAFQLAAMAGGREMMLALTLLTVLGASVATASAGLSMALGAFLAGILMGETEYKAQIEIDLEPFKGLLIGVFFMTVGMSMDIVAIGRDLPLILGLTMALIMTKGLIVGAGARLFGNPNGRAIHMATMLGPAGEFAFVIVGASVVAGLIDTDTAGFVTAVAGLSMIITPFLARFGGVLAKRLAPRDHGVHHVRPVTDGLEGHVIVAGYGRVGRMLDELLSEENAATIAIDKDPKRVATFRKKGVQIFYGDAGRGETLERAGLEHAAQIIVTVDDPSRAERLVRAVRSRRADIPLIARAEDGAHAERLLTAGADFVIHEAAEAALQLAGRALQEFGIAPDTARARLARAREEMYGAPESDGADKAD